MTTTPTTARYGPHQMADHLGVSRAQVDRARELNLLPAPDADQRRWSQETVEQIRAQWDSIAAAIENHRGLGATRIAAQLAEDIGLEVNRADIPPLAEAGQLRVVNEYKDHPLYAVADAEALANDPARVEELAAVVAERQAWVGASLTRRQAAEQLGWRVSEVDRAAAERGINKGWLERYDQADSPPSPAMRS